MSDPETAHAETTTSQADHDHDHAAEPLGPIDVTAWAYALAGGAVGLLVALAMFVARGA
jgi:hypothetical protein